jgi:colanic acid/amylovoran biosynthesis glycosyltransferase
VKIAVVVDSFPALSETFILNQITGLIDLGHRVEIFAGSHSNDSLVHPEVDQYRLLEHTHYINDRPTGKFQRLMGALSIIPACLKRNFPATLRSLNVIRYGTEALSLNLLYKLKGFLAADPFDILACHFGPNGLTGMLLKQLGVPGKVITFFHGYDLSSYPLRHGSKVYEELFQRGDLFLPISDFWKARLISLGCPPEKIRVHHMGIDLGKFRFKPRTVCPGQPVRLVTIARFVEKKGLYYSICAVAKVLSDHPNVEYTIVGDGPLRQDLLNLIQELGVGEKVRLCGWKDAQSILEILAETHILLLHSVVSKNGDMEGIPVSIMEAMAMGIPVISTRHSGIAELVQDGQSGFLVVEKDIDDTAAKINRMIETQETWPEMGAVGRRIVETDFNIKTLNRRFIEICRWLCSAA